MGREVLFDRGAEKCAVGEEVEGNGRGCVEHRLGVDDAREAISLDI
jgi:hypothetical protein